MATMDFSKLLTQIDSVNTKKTYSNDKENYWRMTKDSAGNASAVIRFLPNKEIGDIPFVKRYHHGFKNEANGRWYIENSLSTIGGSDKVGEINRAWYNSGLDENKALAKKQSRKLSYISNILVVKDSASPENEGKVFLFAYGQKIFDKIVAAAKPDEDLGEDPVNAFDPEEGADFLLKQSVLSGFPNYDSSRFAKVKPIGDAATIKSVLGMCYDLALEIAPDKFKSPQELADRYDWVMGVEKKKVSQSADVEAELDSLKELAKETPKAAKKSPPLPVMDSKSDDDSNDDELFFKSLLDY